MAILLSLFSFSALFAIAARLLWRKMAFITTTFTVFIMMLFGVLFLQPDYNYWVELNCALSGYTFCPGTVQEYNTQLTPH